MSEPLQKRIERAQAFLLDMDGTIYLGERLLPGAAAFVERLRGLGRRYLFLTNNSSRDGTAYAAKLTRLGIPTSPDEILTSGEATALYLQHIAPGARLFVLGTPSLHEEFRRRGFRLTDKDPDWVVLGFDTTLTYDKLRRACDLIRTGIPLIATHPDINCPVEGGYIPDAGAILAAIQASTGVEPRAIVGKPSPIIAQMALERLGSPPEATVQIGDRLYTDIACGQQAGLTTVLVLTGETKRDDLRTSPYQPDYVVEHVGIIAQMLRQHDAALL